MKSRLDIPPPPKHAPRLPKEVLAQKIAEEQTTKGLLSKLQRVKRPYNKNTKIVPVTFDEMSESSVTVHVSNSQAEQKALSPAEEFARLVNRRNARLVLQEENYRPYKAGIETGINLLISTLAFSLENQAAVIMAKENATKVAEALVNLKNSNVTITNDMRLTLVANQAEAVKAAEAVRAAEVAKQEAIARFDKERGATETSIKRARTL